MNNTLKLVLVSALVALVVTLGVSTVTSPKVDVSKVTQGPQGEVGPQGPAGPQGPSGPRGLTGSSGQSVSGLESLLSALQGLLVSFKNQPESNLGAVTGPQLPDTTCQAGLCKAVVSGTCNTSSTTLASVNNPFRNSTSSVVRVALDVFKPATTTTAQGSPYFSVGTTTIGTAPAAASATSSSALVSGWVLPNLATTTVLVTGQTGVFTPGVGGRVFDVGPITTFSPQISKAVIWVGGSADTLSGWTNLVSYAGCRYSLEFVASQRF